MTTDADASRKITLQVSRMFELSFAANARVTRVPGKICAVIVKPIFGTAKESPNLPCPMRSSAHEKFRARSST